MSVNKINGNIGMDLTYCEVCGLEADDCTCEADLADEVLDEQEEEE